MSVSSIARFVAREISSPAAKPGCMNGEKLCIDVRQVWEDLVRKWNTRSELTYRMTFLVLFGIAYRM
jgi:hypothetical protein